MSEVKIMKLEVVTVKCRKCGTNHEIFIPRHKMDEVRYIFVFCFICGREFKYEFITDKEMDSIELVMEP